MNSFLTPTLLAGKVAVVAGASRGAGKGIALELARCGATVYVTGRSTPTSRTDNALGSVQQTADEIRALGGTAIPVLCDHSSETDNAALFQQVWREEGRLDIVVLNAWSGNEGFDGKAYADDGSSYFTPVWEQSTSHWTRMMDGGAKLHFLAARAAIPYLLQQGHGLLISTSFFDRNRFLGSVFYDLAKYTICRLAFGMAQQLKPHGIPYLALSPGFMRTERVLDAHPLEELEQTESTAYVGRAVVALAQAAPQSLMARINEPQVVGNLAREFGFTDVDGRQPEPFLMPD